MKLTVLVLFLQKNKQKYEKEEIAGFLFY